MKKVLPLILAILPDKSDTLLFLGMMSIFYGVYQWHPPSAFVITGILFICVALIQILPKPARTG